VDALSRVKVVQVAAGFSHTACVTSDGLLYLWGFGAYGQLGFGFSEVKSSMALGAGLGAVPLSATGGGVTPVPAAVAAAAEGEGGVAAGTSFVGHSRPWTQVWPRRCVRGPFGRRRCVAVQCGTHHTLVRATEEPLEPAAASEPEVLLPAPLELSDLPAASNITEGVDEDLAELVLPPGSGLAESHKTVLRHGAGVLARNTETFRTLAGLFWNTSPSKSPAPAPLPEPRCSHRAVQGWRRALAYPALDGRPRTHRPVVAACEHPLQASAEEEPSGHSLGISDVVQMPDICGPTSWDAVDEAVHRAFVDGSAADQLARLNLAELVAGVQELLGPELPDGEMSRGLPPAPCRGLARMECLTPRPFYLPGGDERPEDRPVRSPTCDTEFGAVTPDGATLGDAATAGAEAHTEESMEAEAPALAEAEAEAEVDAPTEPEAATDVETRADTEVPAAVPASAAAEAELVVAAVPETEVPVEEHTEVQNQAPNSAAAAGAASLAEAPGTEEAPSEGPGDAAVAWVVVGGGDKGGIVVRKELDLKSPELGRLATGARVEQLELIGERLHFRKLAGEGPSIGWVSLSLRGRALLERT